MVEDLRVNVALTIYVFGCISSLQVYRDGIYKLSMNCAREAARQGVRKYIEISTAQMYSTDKVLSQPEQSVLYTCKSKVIMYSYFLRSL